jgi:hypothetical protein
MHSKLSDDNQSFALVTNSFLLCTSVVINTFVFIDPAVLKFFRIAPKISQIMIGVCSTLVFLISLIELRVDWKQAAERHSQACEVLARLKAECREILKSNSQPDSQRVANQCNLCAQTLATLPKILDSKFPALKAYHKSKVELSKMIDSHTGAPVWMLRLALQLRAIRNLISSVLARP